MTEVDARATVTIDSDTLIARLRDPSDQEAWRLVNKRYSPALLSFARKLGLPPEWAEDACQNTMLAFCEAMRQQKFHRYKNGKRQRLRDYLFGIARNKILDLRKERARAPIQVVDKPGESPFVGDLPGENELQRIWETEWDLAIRAQCLFEARQRFSPTTYTIFSTRVIEEHSSAEVAKLVNKTTNAVDLAVHHVRTFLRQIRPEIEAIF